MTNPITEEMLVSLADYMAAAAVSFNAHGYDQFIQARDQFKETAHAVCVPVECSAGQFTERGADRRRAG